MSGLLFAAIGLGALWVALGYPMGTATRMGPGYVPALLSGMLAFLGIVIILKSLEVAREGQEPPPSDLDLGDVVIRLLRPLFFVVFGLLLFAFVLPRYGLVLAVIPLVIISAFADHKPRLLPAIPLAILLATVTVLVFVHGLGLPIRVWP